MTSKRGNTHTHVCDPFVNKSSFLEIEYGWKGYCLQGWFKQISHMCFDHLKPFAPKRIMINSSRTSQIILNVKWRQKQKFNYDHTISFLIVFCMALSFMAILHFALKSKGPWRSSKDYTMQNINPSLQLMGPQAQCNVKVDHVEGSCYMSGFGFPPWQCLGEMLDIISWDPSVSKSNQCWHVPVFLCYFVQYISKFM